MPVKRALRCRVAACEDPPYQHGQGLCRNCYEAINRLSRKSYEELVAMLPKMFRAHAMQIGRMRFALGAAAKNGVPLCEIPQCGKPIRARYTRFCGKHHGLIQRWTYRFTPELLVVVLEAMAARERGNVGRSGPRPRPAIADRKRRKGDASESG